MFWDISDWSIADTPPFFAPIFGSHLFLRSSVFFRQPSRKEQEHKRLYTVATGRYITSYSFSQICSWNYFWEYLKNYFESFKIIAKSQNSRWWEYVLFYKWKIMFYVKKCKYQLFLQFWILEIFSTINFYMKFLSFLFDKLKFFLEEIWINYNKIENYYKMFNYFS